MGDKITWLNNGHTFWDQTLLTDLLQGYNGERQIVVVPGPINEVDEVNMEMEQLAKVLVIVTSDEENKFPTKDLYHPDMKVWSSYPNTKDLDGYLPIGYAPNCRELVKANGMGAKSLDWFFSGQATHPSRVACIEALQGVPNGQLAATEGFAQGLPYEEYMALMCQAKVVPCPAGPFSPDSFRLYEALEAGCIPIVENKDFWIMMFGEFPFPVASSWEDLPELVHHFKDRPDIANKCLAWWLLKKREFKWQFSQF